MGSNNGARDLVKPSDLCHPSQEIGRGRVGHKTTHRRSILVSPQEVDLTEGMIHVVLLMTVPAAEAAVMATVAVITTVAAAAPAMREVAAEAAAVATAAVVSTTGVAIGDE